MKENSRGIGAAINIIRMHAMNQKAHKGIVADLDPRNGDKDRRSSKIITHLAVAPDDQ